jgi:hypothetical protein
MPPLLDMGGFPQAGGPALVDRFGNPLSNSPQLQFMYSRVSEFVASGGESHIKLGPPVRSISFNQICVLKNGTKIANTSISLSGQTLTFPAANANDVITVIYVTTVNTLNGDSMPGVGTTWDAASANSKIVLSIGNTTATNTTTVNTQWHSCRAAATGTKHYWEINVLASSDGMIGVGTSAFLWATDNHWIGENTLSAGYRQDGSVNYNGGGVVSISTYAAGAVIGVAYDQASGKLWFANNGTWQNSGNPSAGTGQCVTMTAGTVVYPAVTGGSSTNNQPSWTLVAAAASMTYTPPSGFSTFG